MSHGIEDTFSGIHIMTNIHKIIDNCKQMNISIRRNDFNLKCYGEIILKIQKKNN